jgi:DNA-binding YbaB/EbfC family protein
MMKSAGEKAECWSPSTSWSTKGVPMKPGGNPMKALQKMQAEMARVQEELENDSVEASVGGGSVKVVMSGDLKVKSISIDATLIDPDDKAMLEDMVGAAVNEALRMAQDLANAKMAKVTSAMGLPPGLM